MKELESVLKIVEEGLRTLAKGVNAVADRLDEIGKQAKPKPKRKTAQKATAKRPRTTTKKNAAPKGKPSATAADSVFDAIKRSTKGVDTAAIMKKTGFDRKKVQNAVFKLKKAGKIKAVSKGVYIKA